MVFSDVTVNFQKNGYITSEDELSVDVCVILLGIIEANITVVLSLEELYLATAGEDFEQLMEPDVIFTPDNAQDVICRQIPLNDDELAEENEMFLVRLNTINDNVLLGSPINVTILDNDSE